MIIPDGYNIGRDFLVAQAISSPTHWNSLWWQAEVEWVEGLLEPGNDGVNHGIDQDGLVAVLTVTRLWTKGHPDTSENSYLRRQIHTDS